MPQLRLWVDCADGAFWLAEGTRFLSSCDNEDWLDCSDARADLSLRWAHMSEDTFCPGAVQFFFYNSEKKKKKKKKNTEIVMGGSNDS